MKRTPKKSGFVLLMVLLVLVISGSILVAAARRCGDESTQAGQTRRELQRRWGAMSCQAALLPMAEKLLTAQRSKENPVVAQARYTLELGGQRFHVILSDETAKLDVNMLDRLYGKEKLATSLQKVQAGESRLLPILLQPAQTPLAVQTTQAAPDPNGPATAAKYNSLEQLFEFRSPAELVGWREGEGSAVERRVTCWGGGKVNIKRTETAVLREALAGRITESQLARLDSYQRKEFKCGLNDILKNLDFDGKQTGKLAGLVTDTSSSHGLWIMIEGSTRNWYYLFIRGAGTGSPESSRVFAW